MPVITFIVDQSDSFISLCVFFTTDRWPQLQASYCFQWGLKICVASPRRAAKCFAKLSPKPFGSAANASVHLFILHLIQKCHPILIKQAARAGSNATCFFFVLLLVRLQRHPVFHICVILCLSWAAAALTTQRRLIRSGAQ